MSTTVAIKNKKIKSEAEMFHTLLWDVKNQFRFRFPQKTRYDAKIQKKLDESFNYIKEAIKEKYKVSK